jgi:hypothetical protein
VNTTRPMLITQRSVVQIHPPQPILSITYRRSPESAVSLLFGPKIVPSWVMTNVCICESERPQGKRYPSYKRFAASQNSRLSVGD